MFGGLARESFGGMFFVDLPEQRRQGIRDFLDLALRDWCSFAEFGPEDRWPKAWAETYVSRCTADVYPWVRRRGVSFLPVVNWVERGEFVPGNSVPRFHVTWGTGKGLAEAISWPAPATSSSARTRESFSASASSYSGCVPISYVSAARSCPIDGKPARRTTSAWLESPLPSTTSPRSDAIIAPKYTLAGRPSSPPTKSSSSTSGSWRATHHRTAGYPWPDFLWDNRSGEVRPAYANRRNSHGGLHSARACRASG